MKTYVILLLFFLSGIKTFAQGDACSNAINIPLDGSINNYSTSSSTGSNVLCSNNGTTPITWFKFTTNSAAETPLLNITASDGQACEIAMYTSCSGSMNNNLQTGSSMCFDDGTGLWAPAHNYTLAANTTYFLRIKTETTTNLQIIGKNYSPANNTCAGATSVDGTSIMDNNATHKPSTEINASDLCAASIENTAFYEYYVATSGTSIINISNISCDNGAGDNIAGFQIGFFSGSCSNLTWIEPCYSGVGSFVQATTGVLPAGTKVYVAVDGFEGSNCKYSIQAINAYVLAEEIKNFGGMNTNGINKLKWTYIGRNSLAYFELERSEDGKSFNTIGKFYKSDIPHYSFEDVNPPPKSYYRLKLVYQNDQMKKSKIIQLNYKTTSQLFSWVSHNILNIQIDSETGGNTNLAILDLYGQKLLSTRFDLKKGHNTLRRDISGLPSGKYVLVIHNSTFQNSRVFIK
jgi:hypothetical protein